MTEAILQAAIAEISSARLGTTEQVLAVHTLARTDSQLRPTYIELPDGESRAAVYFQIVDQPYFFVVVVQANNTQLEAIASYIEASVEVYLAIYSETLDPQIITRRIGIVPSSTKTKGARLRPHDPRTYPEHRWYFVAQPDHPSDPETKVQRLLEHIVPATDKIAALATESQIVLHIVYRGYQGWMGGLHLDTITTQQIAALGAAIDVDLYATGPDLRD
jgi:Domain of unknown function (DUF4279)